MKVEPVQRDGWVVVTRYRQWTYPYGCISFAGVHIVGGWSVLGHGFFCTRNAARARAATCDRKRYDVRVLRARVSLRVR